MKHRARLGVLVLLISALLMPVGSVLAADSDDSHTSILSRIWQQLQAWVASIGVDRAPHGGVQKIGAQMEPNG